MKTWFIADTHFRHKNILEFETRPFNTIEQMEEEMIIAWNNVVAKTDTVYIVGDFCFGKPVDWINILDKLKGNIILIKGNHDNSKVIAKVFNENYLSEIYEVGKIIKLEKMFFYLSHFPMAIGERPQYFNISGHIHNKESDFINQINVGVDSPFTKSYYEKHKLPFGTPISLEYIMEQSLEINEKMKEKYI